MHRRHRPASALPTDPRRSVPERRVPDAAYRFTWLALVLALTACGAAAPTSADGDLRALQGDTGGSGGPEDDAARGDDDGGGAGLRSDGVGRGGAGGDGAAGEASGLGASDGEMELVVDGDDIALRDRDGGTLDLRSLKEADGQLVHAVLRPGDRAAAVVLALFRVEEPDLAPRYELRYLVVDEVGASDLYWFPWRLQVDARVPQVLDVAPLPVWSPDGSTVAWIEWDGEHTTLRLVGWHDDGGSNPSDAVSAFRLPDVEPGTQLESWDGGAVVVLSARGPEGERVEIELDLRHLAMDRAEA